MKIDRRQLLIGSAASVVASSVPVISADPLIRGIVWQTFPFGTEPPLEFMSGQVGPTRGPLKPTSFWLARMNNRAGPFWSKLYWRDFDAKVSG
jgi:hypothetical protein